MLTMTALALLLGLAGLSTGCATQGARVSVRQARNLVFGPAIFGIRPTDTPRAPWPVTDAPLKSTYARTEIRDIQHGSEHARDTYYRRFDSVRSVPARR